MTQQHPITPPPELVQQWKRTAPHPSNEHEHYHYITLCAAQWGADQELDACCALLGLSDSNARDFLQSARRPKPPSLKEQALDLLDKAEDPSWDINDFSIVRRALEALPDSIVVFPSQC
jgi:hypothetical protein